MKKNYLILVFFISLCSQGQTVYSYNDEKPQYKPIFELGYGAPWLINIGAGCSFSNQVLTVNFKTLVFYNEISTSYSYYINKKIRLGASFGLINRNNLFRKNNMSTLFIGTNLSYKMSAKKGRKSFFGRPELTLGMQFSKNSNFGISNKGKSMYFMPTVSINIPISLKRKETKKEGKKNEISENEIIKKDEKNPESNFYGNKADFEDSIKNKPGLLNKYSQFQVDGVESDFFISNEQMGAIIINVKSYMGTKYLYGGASKSGIDCSGLLSNGFSSQNIEIPRTAQEIARLGVIVYDSSKLIRGDLVFFSNTTSSKKLITHMGLYLGNGEFIHSSSSRGVIISKINDPYYWRDKFLFGKRILK